MGFNSLAKQIIKAKESGSRLEVQKLQQKVDKKESADINMVVDYIKEGYPQTESMFKEVLNEMYLTFCKKQFDYGPGNISMGTALKDDQEVNTALLGIIVRLNDKINRLVNLSTKHNFESKNEPIEDAFLDIAVYSVMALIVKDRKWSK
tara:strand:+ start:133 stop:579 length:447 start_codon:yes stop_codon:yes gene_type:complete